MTVYQIFILTVSHKTITIDISDKTISGFNLKKQIENKRRDFNDISMIDM
jgi:hypothetical protein